MPSIHTYEQKTIVPVTVAITDRLSYIEARKQADTAVEFDNINVGEATLFRKRIQGKISEKVDIQVYNVLPIKLKKEIDSKGRSIYDKNS